MERYIRDRPEREKLHKIRSEFEFIGDQLKKFESQGDTVSNAKALITTCKPKLLKIKKIIGEDDDLYIKLSSLMVRNSQNMIVDAVNEKLEEHSSSRLSSTKQLLLEALDTLFHLGTFDMNSDLKLHYKKNLKSVKSLAQEFNISTLSPKEKLQDELNNAEKKLKQIHNQTFFDNQIYVSQRDFNTINSKLFYESEIKSFNEEMDKIMEWRFLRSKSNKALQIADQQRKINDIIEKAKQEKQSELNRIQRIINNLQKKSEEEKTHQISVQTSNIKNIKSQIKNAEY